MKLDLHVTQQPDDESCGITCLKAIYDYYAHPTSLATLQHEIEHWQTGGTVAVNLARHALAHGYDAEIYTYNLKIFDPTWKDLPPKELSHKLRLRQRRVRSVKQKEVIRFYQDFLKKGGKVRFDDLDEDLMGRLFRQHKPVICGLSATYLYQQPRETHDNVEDDVAGNPVGHFVVVSAWDPHTRMVTIQDPLRKNPFSETGTYRLPFVKFSNAVMLGILTYDENLLAIAKR
jgi:hypothetical protein